MAKYSLYTLHKKSADASSSYISSLYDASDVSSRMKYTEDLFKIKSDKSSNIIDTLSAAASLGSKIYGGYEAKKEFEENLSFINESIAKKEYEEYSSEQAGISPNWDELGVDEKQLWLNKSRPIEKERSYWDNIFGREPEYSFGKDSDKFYKKSNIIATTNLMDFSGASSLYDRMGFNFNDISDFDNITSNISIGIDNQSGEVTDKQSPSISTQSPYFYEDNMEPYTLE